METDDLWPEIPTSGPLPLTILKDQAALLANKTDRLVIAEVRTMKSEENDFAAAVATLYAIQSPKSTGPRPTGKGIYHTMYAVAPLLDNYRVELLTIWHPIALKPILLRSEFPTASQWFDVTQDVRKTLAVVLRSEQTKALLSSLLSQSREASKGNKEST